ncbi:protein PTCD3-like protein [Dinothrombium tinctorium]|uniref:Small ribosomal subunit protein mS39 n=1 Tax=Dinothrombium tinctorium TaxID=1965070 RepID=A0A443RC29_9ACAR|nr:protein PTCD3-like protein [Dinothrombium tinctorium]
MIVNTGSVSTFTFVSFSIPKFILSSFDYYYRGPTDILKALASTVSRDFTAAHYKYMDDPFLLPSKSVDVVSFTLFAKSSFRAYALSKESGRKAARYFLNTYPELFFRDDAEPKVPAFCYRELYDENTDNTEDDLRDCIANRDVPNCIIAYNNMEAKDVKINPELKQSLLELVCFYNSKEARDEEFLEEEWFQSKKENIVRRTWQDGEFAEQLFDSLPKKDARAYCTLIQGMGKYFQAGKAFKLYEEMKELNYSPTVAVFNYLIENVVFIQESGELRFEMITKLLRDMSQYNLKPNVNTFNAILFVLSRSTGWNKASNIALNTFAEMKLLNVQPSLASYYYLLLVLSSKNNGSNILYEIVREIEGKSFAIKHPADVNFFEYAMHVCCNFLSDVELGYRIHNLLSTGQNHKFFSTAYSEAVYYRNFFSLLCLSESTDTLMDVYNKYVPNIYIPEAKVMQQILQNIELYDTYHYIPQIFSDITTFQLSFRGDLADTVLTLIAKKKHQDENLQKQFVAIAWSLFNTIVERNSNVKIFPLHVKGEMYSKMILIFLNGKDFEKASAVLKYLVKEKPNDPATFIEGQTLKLLCDASLENKMMNTLKQTIDYASVIGCADVIKHIIENNEKYSLSEEFIEKFIQSSNLEAAKEDSSSSESSEPSETSESPDESSDEEK